MKNAMQYKGYTLTVINTRYVSVKNGSELINTIQGSLACAEYYVDTYCEPIEPIDTHADPYEGLDIPEDLPTSEVVNEALGLKTDPFMELLDKTKDQQSNDKPFEKPTTFEDLTEEQKKYYYMGWHDAEAKYQHDEIKVLKGWV
jgi:hypothetical protein